MKIRLGKNLETHQKVYFPDKALDRHLHLIGGTGSGKTTALVTLLTRLFCKPFDEKCCVILDRLGGFSEDLLRWFASDFCPPFVREKLIYIELADEDRVVPLHPLSHTTPGEAYFRTSRAMEIVLRAFAAQDLSQQPRLARWLFNAFFGACQLGMCIADCRHFLNIESDFHRPMIGALPMDLQSEWQQILSNKNQADIQLDSTRNRLKPFFYSNVLKWMFSSTQSRFDIHRWMNEKKIVIVNLAPKGKVDPRDADTVGGLIVNEVLSVARSLPPQHRQDTVLVLDEFQRFVNADLEFALAESRQLRVKLILSHQSFSQLEQGDVDLTSLIFQCGSRLILNSRGDDAEKLADELAGFTYNPNKIHDEIWHTTQRITGHRVVELQNRSTTEQLAEQWSDQFGRSDTSHRNFADADVTGYGSSDAQQYGHKKGRSSSTGQNAGVTESLVPIYDDYQQIASRNYSSFDQQKHEWGKDIRKLKTGHGVLQLVDDPNLQSILVDNFAVGSLALPWSVICEEVPLEREAYDKLKEENFRQDCFVAPALIEAETIQRLEQVAQLSFTPVVRSSKQPSSPNPMD